MRRSTEFDHRDLVDTIVGRKYAGAPRDVPVRVVPKASINKLAPVDEGVHPTGPLCKTTFAAPTTRPLARPHQSDIAKDMDHDCYPPKVFPGLPAPVFEPETRYAK